MKEPTNLDVLQKNVEQVLKCKVTTPEMVQLVSMILAMYHGGFEFNDVWNANKTFKHTGAIKEHANLIEKYMEDMVYTFKKDYQKQEVVFRVAVQLDVLAQADIRYLHQIFSTKFLDPMINEILKLQQSGKVSRTLIGDPFFTPPQS